ncbi:uncharacterized protein [Eurosta solidaginis]
MGQTQSGPKATITLLNPLHTSLIFLEPLLHSEASTPNLKNKSQDPLLAPSSEHTSKECSPTPSPSKPKRRKFDDCEDDAYAKHVEKCSESVSATTKCDPWDDVGQFVASNGRLWEAENPQYAKEFKTKIYELVCRYQRRLTEVYPVYSTEYLQLSNMKKVNAVKFLECYEQHPCLWDPRNKFYKHPQHRTTALNAMIDELKLGISIEELKQRIRSLRTMYTREFGKIIASKESGVETNDVYVPRVAWFKVADRFLKAVIEGKPSSNSNMAHKIQSSANRRESEAFYFGGQSNSQPNVPDEFDTFGAHVAQQLRYMPLDQAIASQAYITNFLARRRLAILGSDGLNISRPESSVSGKYSAQNSTTTMDMYENEDYFDNAFFINDDEIEVETKVEPQEEGGLFI